MKPSVSRGFRLITIKCEWLAITIQFCYILSMKMEKLHKTYDPLLKAVGLKTTTPRLAILDALNSAKLPFTAQEIHTKIKQQNIDQATVYRNLETLTEVGLIRLVNFQHDHNHYELAKNHHHHAICQSCGKVVDISQCDLAALEKQVKKISGFGMIDHHALEFFGLCKTCNARQAQK